jgi:type I restriction enzyme, S subunit
MWKTVKLGDKCKIETGNSIPVKKKEALYSNLSTGIPYVGTKDLGYDGTINFENGILIPTKHSSKFKLSKKESILICVEGGSAGRKIAFSNKECCFGNKLASISANNELLPKYIYYYTLGEEFQNQFKNSMHGLIGGVSLSKIKDFKITYPSLKKQHQVVAKLETAFSAVNNIVDNNNKKISLTESIEKILLTTLINKKTNLNKIKLEEICVIKGRIGYRGYTKQDITSKGKGAISLSPSNIINNKLDFKKTTYISWSKYNESPEIMIKSGNIIFCKTGSTYGKTAYIENLPEKATLNPQLVVLKDIKCNKKYLYYYMLSDNFKFQIENIIGGAAMPTLSQKDLSKNTILLPPKDVQEDIVNNIDNTIKNTGKILHDALLKIKYFSTLKQKILQKELGDLNE